MARRAKKTALALDAGCVGCWGRRGSGKSTWAKRWLEDKPRAIVFDPQAEYGAAGFTVFESQRQLARHVLANWGGFRAALVPTAGAEASELSALCWWLNDVQLAAQAQGKRFERIALAVEELNLSFRQQGEHKCTGFAELCSRGRHRQIEMIGMSQRLAEVSTRFRGNCTETVIFAQGDRNDREAAARQLDVDIARVQQLQPLEFLHSAGGKIEAGTLTFR